MARTDARLELRKARKHSAALELNPLLVVRYVAVLQGTSLPPSLACSPGDRKSTRLNSSHTI